MVLSLNHTCLWQIYILSVCSMQRIHIYTYVFYVHVFMCSNPSAETLNLPVIHELMLCIGNIRDFRCINSLLHLSSPCRHYRHGSSAWLRPRHRPGAQREDTATPMLVHGSAQGDEHCRPASTASTEMQKNSSCPSWLPCDRPHLSRNN